MRQVRQDLKKVLLPNPGNQQGQAVIEYILMLVVIVSLIVASGKLFKPLNDFMQNYMGNYIECLMAYGELPSLGVEEADLKKHTNKDLKKCDTQFTKFSFGSGRQSVGGSSGNQNAGGRGGSDKDNKNSSNSADKKGEDKDGSSTDQSGRNRYGSSSGRRSPYQSGQISRAGDAGTADGLSSARAMDSSKSKLIPGEEEGLLEGRRSGYSSYGSSSSRPKYKAVTGKLAEELDKKNATEKNKEPIAKAITPSEEEGYRFQPRRSTINPPEKRDVAGAKDQDLSFGFGDFIKWLFVIGVFVGLVVFFGSQLLGISNSKE